ncbi:polysaccharide lyase family 7 protein [Tenacibaculum jejuense]|uniref:Alginate lyase, family PL7 n=1 Tax=Tenacibaculum jejuense TaxID=584609 RepID=A0A238U6K4_9FLAO|nr:polysaccharide lyase family 7 protein [Tenacibaculum jejuense]SNR14813.1 Alginate lyase precursor, family PL7 [Tenacibaculum jejuense]
MKTLITLNSKHKYYTMLAFLIFLSCTDNSMELNDLGINVEEQHQSLKNKIIDVNEISVSANGDDGNIPSNTLDGNLNTRWSSKGRTGKYITYDLGKIRKIDAIRIAWFKGNQRKTFFQVAVGNSTSSLTTILNRKSNGSSGNSNGFEFYELPDTEGRFLRIRGFGNSSNDWNSITEIEILTTTSNGSTAVIQVPSRIQAEDFTSQKGTQTEATSDTGGGLNVGYIDAGDYLEYEIDVPETKDYNFEFRVASLNKTIRFDVISNGNRLAGISKATTNGWQNWITTKKTIRLNKGIQTLRLLATDGGWNINWLEIKEDQSNPDPNPTPGSSPASILGGLKNWKLNGYSGTFQLGASNNGLTYVDKTPNLQTFSNPEWFYTDGTWTYFKAYPGNPTSSGSGNPRSELRELTTNGNANIYWDGTTSKEHRMIWKVKVDRLPQSGKVCFGQIHDKTDKFDDVIRVQCQGDPFQTSGEITLRINGYVTEVLEGGGKSVGKIRIGEELYYELTYQNSVVKLYELNSSGSRVKTIFTSKKAAAKENYFKAGCYLQSVKGKKAKGPNDFGLVGIKELKIFH